MAHAIEQAIHSLEVINVVLFECSGDALCVMKQTQSALNSIKWKGPEVRLCRPSVTAHCLWIKACPPCQQLRSMSKVDHLRSGNQNSRSNFSILIGTVPQSQCTKALLLIAVVDHLVSMILRED